MVDSHPPIISALPPTIAIAARPIPRMLFSWTLFLPIVIGIASLVVPPLR
jgi:hypothetical protein